MSKNYGVSYYAHNSIYSENYLEDNYKKRKVRAKFSIPKNGVDKETGIVLFIAGYGGNSNSKVYKKIRSTLADKYNLVTVQCDYFGWEFMQSETSNVRMLKDNGNEVIIESYLNETLNNFNDMGIMQAIDNIMVTLKVIRYLENKKLKFNYNKIMIMGNSHGSYLGYLCNSICPGLYSHILDNSAWVYPKYCKMDRVVGIPNNKVALQLVYRYKVKEMKSPIICMRIKDMYKNIDNMCKIVVYHGADDKLITVDDKYAEIKNINNIEFNVIDDNKVDGDIFKSSTHGLNADFIKLFEKFYEEYCTNTILKENIDILNTVNMPGGYIIDYTSYIPIVMNLNS